MPSTDNRRNGTHGAFCGLKKDLDSDFDGDDLSVNMNNKNLASDKAMAAHTKRPQSLTLPFENRDRDSHLVTEEEFDRIIEQERLEQPLPSLPTIAARTTSGFGLRRSISTARHKQLSLVSQKTRPTSTDLSKVFVGPAISHDQSSKSLVATTRDPTLTALPRAPTVNNFLVYPLSPTANGGRKRNSRAGSLGCLPIASTSSKVEATAASHDQTSLQQPRGHKRSFSAADMLESVRKRLKREEMPVSNPEPPQSSVESPDNPTKILFEVHPAVQPHTSNGKTPLGTRHADSQPASPATSSFDLKKTLLKRTWSKAKQAARNSISSAKSLTTSPSSSPQPGRNTPAPSFRTQTSSTTKASSGYQASPEPSPLQPHRPPTPILTPPRGSYEFVSGPSIRPGLLSKVGGPPSRAQLHTVVTRQQNRIVDLTLQNDVLVNQIDMLRGQVEELRLAGNGKGNSNSNGTSALMPRSQDARGLRIQDRADQTNETAPVRKRRGAVSARGGATGSVMTDQSFDANGWRTIVGVSSNGTIQLDEHDVEQGDFDDRRKTWMTCDS